MSPLSSSRLSSWSPWLQLLLVVLLAMVTSPASAEIGTPDPVPAATLLLPYFEVDLDDPQGVNTVFTVSNARYDPAIVNITLWTDWSVPTLVFNAYLTGYDVMDVNLRTLFAGGSVPQTSHNNTAVSPVGSFSRTTNPDSGVGPGSSSCNSILPLPSLPLALLTHIRRAHTGQSSAIFGGSCSGTSQGDNVVRGYITVDNVNSCTLDIPGDPGYFVDGGTGAANNINALTGAYRIFDPSSGIAHGNPLVHLEASSDDPRTAPGRYTFYSRYSGGADNREPLANTVAASYVNQATDLIYWRDSKVRQNPISCGSTPSWFPLTSPQIVLFDQEENPEIVAGSPISPPAPPNLPTSLPAEAGRVTVGSDSLPASFARGWLYLNLNASVGSGDTALAQGWVEVMERDPSGLFATSQPGWQLLNTSEGENLLLPCTGNFPGPLCGVVDGIFADGFESGTTAGWSATKP